MNEELPASAAALARELGVSPRRMRLWIRSQWPRTGADRFYVRVLTDEQAALARARFQPVAAKNSAVPSALLQGSAKAAEVQVMRLSVAREALRLRAQADRLLRAVGVTKNDLDLVGQLAEYLVAAAFGGTPAPASQAGYDVTLPDGARVQVKSRIGRPGVLGKQVFMRGFAKNPRPFDQLIYLQFAPDYELERAVRFRVEDVAPPVAVHIPHSNNWRLRMTAAFLAKGDDVLDRLRATYDGLA